MLKLFKSKPKLRKKINKKFLAILLGLFLGGFGLLAINGFSEFFGKNNASPEWKIFIGLVGFIIVSLIIKKLRIKIQHLK